MSNMHHIGILRQRSGAGLMDCKKALDSCDGNLEKALIFLQKSGRVHMLKKQHSTAGEGVLFAHCSSTHIAVVTLATQTDFVARNKDFINFAQDVVRIACTQCISSLDKILMYRESTKTFQEKLEHLIYATKEKITICNITIYAIHGNAYCYIHSNQLITYVDLDGGSQELAKDIAVHITALDPMCINRETLNPQVVQTQTDILLEQFNKSGKPEHLRDKIIDGRLREFFKEHVLLEQKFLKEPSVSVQDILERSSSHILSFKRISVRKE